MNLAWLLRGWLAQQAQANLRDRVRGAVQEELSARASAQATAHADDLPCDVGIVFALSAESGGTEDLLATVVTTKGDGFLVRSGLLDGRRIAVVLTGAGRAAAARGTQALIRGHRPAWIVSAGFAGGLQPQLRRFDIVMANEILDISGARLSIDLQRESSRSVHVGRLLTVDRLICKPAEKAALGAAHQALAVDMESWAVGEVCRQDKVRFLSVRVISDAVDDELPEDLNSLITQKTTAGRLGAAAGTLFRRPGSAKDMLRLREDALVASDRLARFLDGVIRLLIPRDAGE
ncbi:MAG TPA: hypothetical protein VHD36_22645 [Pirellulales bacterium]|nr:hypothetical protein [Pirellulales bacterium]